MPTDVCLATGELALEDGQLAGKLLRGLPSTQVIRRCTEALKSGHPLDMNASRKLVIALAPNQQRMLLQQLVTGEPSGTVEQRMKHMAESIAIAASYPPSMS